MGGGLMQLVAYGAQDIYLTGNPQITFFKVVYRRHTNFSMEAIEQTINGTVSANNSITSTISRNGDLVGRMYVQHDPGAAVTENNYGYHILKEVECEIGGQKIDKHYNHWLNTWAELTELNPTGSSAACSTDLGSNNPTKFQRMACAGGVTDNSADTGMLFIPLQFWFCRNPGLALPLIALQYHEVKIKITFSAALDTTGTTKLFADYIYLDTDERRRFAQVSHEYLIEQVQHVTSAAEQNVELNFNHPVKELIWAGNWSSAAGTGGGINVVLTAANTYQLKLNGHDRFAARDRLYFTRAQVWQHHTGFGGVTLADTLAVYSFALKPEEHQPSGTCNFSRIDNAQLVQTGTPQILEIYAVNYNVLRIMSGMGGLAYSN
jgi:hypothetical protein